MALQKRFFGHFLKGADTGWRKQPPVYLNVRRVDDTFEQRAEQQWPLARTQWTKFHLAIEARALSSQPVTSTRSVAAPKPKRGMLT